MSDIQIDSEAVPPKCLQDIQVYLRTTPIVAKAVQSYQADILGVPCRVDCEGLGKDSSLVIIAARPVETATWNFGNCFRELPGGAEERSPERPFRMRFLTLSHSLWLFVWGRDVKQADVRDRLAAAPWFQEWTKDRKASDARAMFDSLGFDSSELQAVPHASWRSRDGESKPLQSGPGEETSTGGLFLWGDLAETGAIGSASQATEVALLLGDMAQFLGSSPLRFTKAKVECEGGFAHLILRLPAGGLTLRSTGGDGSEGDTFAFRNFAIYFSSIPYLTPQDTTVAVEGEFTFLKDKRVKIDLAYPIDGDLIWAKGTYTGGAQALLGSPDAFQFPGLPPTWGANEKIALELEFSRSARELVKLSFGLEMHQRDWVLVKSPIYVRIDGGSFYFTVFQPLDASRSVVGEITLEATLGGDGDPRDHVQLACGGSYPSGDLFFQARNKVPIGRLIDRLLGTEASQGLDQFVFDDLRLEYNYKSSRFALQFTVPEKWQIVEVFRVGDLQFKIKGERPEGRSDGDLSCNGSLAATLEIAKVDVRLEAIYQDPGWQFHGSTGPGQDIRIGELIDDLAQKFNTDNKVPDAIKTLVFRNLALSFNTGKKKSFRFTGEASLQIEGTTCEIALTVELEDEAGSGKFDKRFRGTLKAGGALFTLDLKARQAETDLLATWKKSAGALQLDLGDLSSSPELSSLKTLLTPPEEATLNLNLGDDNKVKRLAITCKLENGLETAFLLARDPSATKPSWTAALGLAPPKISTNQLGVLGSVLAPYDITLNKLRVVAANADAPKGEQLTLAKQQYTVTKGFLLQGTLEFGGTSYSYPFECRLGGDQKPRELPATGAGAGASTPAGSSAVALPARKSAEPTLPEAENNVAVGRTIGPVTFRKARLESRDERVYLLLDASLEGGGLALSLTGLNLNFPLKRLMERSPEALLREMEVGLDGLSISYSNPPLTISGGLARATGAEPFVGDVYRGYLLIKAEAFQITVLGSYGNIEVKSAQGEIVKDGKGKPVTTPSLFLYGAFVGALGGPAAFFVTGLALGGGYNTRLALPKIEEVADFPLILAVTSPEKFAKNPAEGIEKLCKVMQPSFGDYWLAVGVKFDSFRMADSFALFSVSFGTRLQFALLGLTKLTLPRGVARDKAALYAELAIRAVLDPEAGVFSIEGRLTQSSYVLAKELHLTGGFAFFVWFGNAKEAGDFVISLGGYHPDFLPPPHYPVVPRVGIRGKIGPLAVTGEAYLAITPSCVMAGQRLEAVFETDVILVTFVAYADFLIAWAPFHYDARIGIGISVTIQELRSFKLELTASLHIWGPPFAGTALVSLATISYSVEFGDQSGEQPALLEWAEFQTAFLPASDSSGKGGGLSNIRITEGLVREVKRENETLTHRIVNPYELMIETDSVVPCSEVGLGAISKNGAAGIGIRPMGATALKSSHMVSVTRNGVSPDESSVELKFKPVQWSRKNYPEALWSDEQAKGKPGPGMIKNVPSGLVLRVQPNEPAHRLGPFLIEKFKHDLIPKKIPWPQAAQVPAATGSQDFAGVSVRSQLRDQIRGCLVKYAQAPETCRWNEIALKNLTGTPDQQLEYFQAPPTCAALGQSL
jgi:hypothetical protein